MISECLHKIAATREEVGPVWSLEGILLVVQVNATEPAWLLVSVSSRSLAAMSAHSTSPGSTPSYASLSRSLTKCSRAEAVSSPSTTSTAVSDVEAGACFSDAL